VTSLAKIEALFGGTCCLGLRRPYLDLLFCRFSVEKHKNHVKQPAFSPIPDAAGSLLLFAAPFCTETPSEENHDS
jgi:hypothetical protein